MEGDTYKLTPASNGDVNYVVVGDARDKITVEVAGTLDSTTANLDTLSVSVGEAQA